ncbi:hydroxyacylglutathione hydrolase [Cupriavidus basilensis OR16]|uniref:Hydroxyacylglutathione hydrolase n=1 Tax=Cupriavidus basilensis OR16 TaxID=1127483 RepID=H1SHH5_9BURK|nr:hydroxyacylglutathione hydrolase [Cupriavidus basilensis OR16]
MPTTFTPPTLPGTMRVFERGWLSANNILFVDGDDTALVDSGYATHAPQTLALVEAGLGGRRLRRLVNTHLHSDHCGGNATLQHRWQPRTLIPAAEAEAVRAWDVDALSYRATGQQCDRFTFDEVVQDGDTLRLGGIDWQVVGAPGHDPHAVMLFAPCPRGDPRPRAALHRRGGRARGRRRAAGLPQRRRRAQCSACHQGAGEVQAAGAAAHATRRTAGMDGTVAADAAHPRALHARAGHGRHPWPGPGVAGRRGRAGGGKRRGVQPGLSGNIGNIGNAAATMPWRPSLTLCEEAVHACLSRRTASPCGRASLRLDDPHARRRPRDRTGAVRAWRRAGAHGDPARRHGPAHLQP